MVLGQTSPGSDPPAVLTGKGLVDQGRGDWKSGRPECVRLTCTGRTGTGGEPEGHLKVKSRLGRNRQIRGKTGGCTFKGGFQSQWKWQVVPHGDHVPVPLYMLFPGVKTPLP